MRYLAMALLVVLGGCAAQEPVSRVAKQGSATLYTDGPALDWQEHMRLHVEEMAR